MRRRVVLVDLFWTRDKDPRIPLGHASLLTSLLRHDQHVESRSIVVAVNSHSQAGESVASTLLGQVDGCLPEDADIAIGAYVWGEELLREVLAQLREQGFRGRIILGGPQVSYSGAGLEQIYPEADVYVRGYGEAALCALVRSRRQVVIPGVHWAGTADQCQPAEVDLDALPSPWLDGIIDVRHQRFIRWETQRGCPFRCAFCQHREPGARLRRRSLDSARLREEIDLFCDADVAEIAVLDPIFNLGGHGTSILERFAERRFRGLLSLQCRAEYVVDDFLDAASALNVRLEFGLQTVHNDEGDAIQRRNNIEKVDAVLHEVRRRGINHEVSLIFGLPRQTLSSFEASVRWCLEREVPVIKAFPLLLLRGTPLERERQRWGLVDGGGAMPMVVESNTFSRDDWLAMARIAEVLHSTEGRHPRGVSELLDLARNTTPNTGRWQAPAIGNAE